VLTHQTPENLNALAFSRKRRIGGHACFHAECISGIEFAIYVGMNSQRSIFVAGTSHHVDFPPIVSIT
jgi:hypothetical protein